MREHRGRLISTSRWIMMIGGLAGASAAGAQIPAARVRAAPIPVRPPTIVLAHPDVTRASARWDDEALVFRFAAGDAADPLDFGSFRVLVDGADRTKRFRITAGEAWGAIESVGPAATRGSRPLHIEARICSVRGLCATVLASVAAVPRPAIETAAVEPDRGAVSRQRWKTMVLELVRRLLALPSSTGR